MLNSEKAMFALNNIDDNYLESARIRLGYKTGSSVTRKKEIGRAHV